jgi:hypothetical protein
MADDPWGQFVPKSNDPWAQFVAPPSQGSPTPAAGTSAPISPSAPGGVGQSSTPGGQDLGSTAIWNKPADASWSDYLLAHMAKQGQGAGQAADDYGRAISDTATFGQADRLASYMNGTNLADERAQTQAAHQRLGAGDYIANAAGYLPLGELGIAGKLGGGLLGMTGEGAALGAAGAAGHDQNITQGALAGGAGGFAGGALSKAVINPIAGGIAGKLGMAPDINAAAGDITSKLEADTTAKFKKADDVFYPATGKANPVFDATTDASNAIDTQWPGLGTQNNAPQSMSVLTKLRNQASAAQSGSQVQTGGDILTAIQKLDRIQRASRGTPEDAVAPIVQQHLQNVLDTVQPITPGQPAGYGAQVIADANAAHKLSSNAADLQQWAQSLRGFGASPASSAQTVAEKWYNNPNLPEYKALSNIANSGGAPGGQNAYTLTHGVVHPLVEGAAFAALPPGIAPAAAAAATFMGIKPALGAAMGAGSKAAQMNSIYKAYPTLTGQQFTPPGNPDAGAALRALILGHAAAGGQ